MKLITLVVSTILFFSSCKKIQEEESTVSDLNLVGSWSQKSSCTSNSGTYGKTSYVFTSNSYINALKLYSDSSCSSLMLTATVTAGYSISDVKKGLYAYDAYFDETLTGYTLTLNNSSLVTSYNSSNFCGYNDWVLNSPKNVLGKNCNGSQMPTAGTVNYNIIEKVFSDFTIGGGSFSTTYTAGDLYFGVADSAHDGTTAGKRFTTISLNYIYRLQ